MLQEGFLYGVVDCVCGGWGGGIVVHLTLITQK